jgi:hypothetical protein
MFEFLFTVQVQKLVQKNGFLNNVIMTKAYSGNGKDLIKSTYSNLNYLALCSIDLLTFAVGEGGVRAPDRTR